MKNRKRREKYSKKNNKNNQQININKVILDAGLLFFGWPEPV
jgi:hypothetical protein